MATFYKFRCENCRYTIEIALEEHYALMSGIWAQFLCSHCREIVSISEREANPVHCPICNLKNTLTIWNPNNGNCPKCGGRLKQTGLAIMAD